MAIITSSIPGPTQIAVERTYAASATVKTTSANVHIDQLADLALRQTPYAAASTSVDEKMAMLAKRRLTFPSASAYQT